MTFLERLARILRSRTFLTLMALLLVGGIAVFAVLQRREPEPSYKDVPASDWIDICNTNQQRMVDSILAFQNMGPAGAEFLGRELVRQPSKLDQWMLAHHQSIPGPFKKTLLKPQRQVWENTVLQLLSGIHTNAAPAIPMLIDWLESTNGTVKSRVFSTNANVIPSINPSRFQITYTPTHAPSIPVIIGTNPVRTAYFLTGGSLTVQTQVMVTAPGQVTTNYVLITHSISKAIPTAAFELLRTIGSSDPRVIPLLLRPVENRYQSSLRPPPFTTNLKTAALQSIPLLVQKSASPDLREKLIALALLKLTLPESSAAKEVFIERLSDNDYQSFNLAMEALRPFTNDLDRIIPLALDGLRNHPTTSPEAYTSRVKNVAPTLKEFVRYSPKVIPGLEKILRDSPDVPDPGIIQLLGELGASHHIDLAFIGSFTNHHANAVRAQAWLAIASLTGDTDAAAVYEMASKNRSAQWVSVIELGSLGTKVKSAVPMLREALKNEEDRIVAKAAESLGKIGPAAKEALPDLEALRKHPQLMVREPVEEAIRLITAEPVPKPPAP